MLRDPGAQLWRQRVPFARVHSDDQLARVAVLDLELVVGEVLLPREIIGVLMGAQVVDGEQHAWQIPGWRRLLRADERRQRQQWQDEGSVCVFVSLLHADLVSELGRRVR